MAGLYFIIGNLIVLGLNIAGLVLGEPSIGFASAVLYLTAGLTGKITNNTNIFLFWLSLGLAVVYTAFGFFALL